MTAHHADPLLEVIAEVVWGGYSRLPWPAASAEAQAGPRRTAELILQIVNESGRLLQPATGLLRDIPAMRVCPCFYFELDTEAETEQTCTCGHVIDEHDEEGDCVMLVEA